MENKVTPFIPPEDSDNQDDSEKIRDLDELKNTFIALVSHELRTPLNLMAGYLDLGMEELETNTKKAREYLDLVEENTNKLMRVVQELTDFTRLQLGKEITFLDPIPIGDAFVQTYDLLKPNLQKKNINLVADLPDEVRDLRYDGESLIILLRNLLSNAAKFSMEDGKVLIVGKIHNEHVSFEDFRQLENYLTRRYEGMGLGLAVARRTARFLGGNIQLDVREDGNTFEIILPLEGSETRE